jgi:hypothetical protein
MSYNLNLQKKKKELKHKILETHIANLKFTWKVIFI